MASVYLRENQFWASSGHSKGAEAFVDRLIICALDELPHRPDRNEPRAIKRRLKPFQVLTPPRAHEKTVHAD